VGSRSASIGTPAKHRFSKLIQFVEFYCRWGPGWAMHSMDAPVTRELGGQQTYSPIAVTLGIERGGSVTSEHDNTGEREDGIAADWIAQRLRDRSHSGEIAAGNLPERKHRHTEEKNGTRR
jgi:hypothetical protein